MEENNSTDSIQKNKDGISEMAVIERNVQLIMDETSNIYIDDYSIISAGCIIIATNNSYIHIGKKCIIGENVVISAENNATIHVKEECKILERTNISVKWSRIVLYEKVLLGKYGIVSAVNNATISIGKATTIYDYLYIVSDKSSVIIGKDCMFSCYVKINVGSHKIIDMISKKDITNIELITIGNHVWCGINVMLLPGCNVEDGCVIGASSLVNKHISKNSTCAGNPAKVLRSNIEWFRK